MLSGLDPGSRTTPFRNNRAIEKGAFSEGSQGTYRCARGDPRFVWSALLLASILVVDLTRMESVTTAQAHRICADSVEACTAGQGGMAGWCVETSSGWAIRTSVRLTPVMYLSSRRLEDHERQHITDLAFRLRHFQDAIGLLNFASRLSCASAVEQERLGFPSRLDTFVRESNARLH